MKIIFEFIFLCVLVHMPGSQTESHERFVRSPLGTLPVTNTVPSTTTTNFNTVPSTPYFNTAPSTPNLNTKPETFPATTLPSSPSGSTCESCTSPSTASPLSAVEELLKPLDETLPLNIPGLPYKYWVYKVSQQAIKATIEMSSECGNKFVIYGVLSARFYSQTKNMLQIGLPRSREGQKIYHATQLATFGFSGVYITFILYGYPEFFDVAKWTNLAFQWDGGILPGVRCIMMVDKKTNLRVLITGRDLSIVKVPEESKTTVYGIISINIIFPCPACGSPVVVKEKESAIRPGIDGSTTVVQQIEKRFAELVALIPDWDVFIDSLDGGTFGEIVSASGFTTSSVGRVILGGISFVFVGESIDIKVPCCWTVTPISDGCSGQVLVLGIQQPGMCFLLVLVAKPKCDSDFQVVNNAGYVIVQGVYSVSIIPSGSPWCSSCAVMPPLSYENKLDTNPAVTGA